MVSDFIFDGRTLSSFGYILVFENTENTIDVSQMEMENIKAAKNDRSYGVGYKYANNYSGTYFIMKNPCDDPNNVDMTDEEISMMTRWLCRKHYKWFRFIDDTETMDDIWYLVSFQVQKDYIGDDIVGLRLTLNTNAPYGFTKEIQHTYTTGNFKIFTNSDEEGYIYPDVIITLREPGNLRLTNTTEGRTTALNNCVRNEVITLQGYDIQQITSTNTQHDFVTEFNYKFPRLWDYYVETKNEFTCNLQADIQFKYREVRKVGLK